VETDKFCDKTKMKQKFTRLADDLLSGFCLIRHFCSIVEMFYRRGSHNSDKNKINLFYLGLILVLCHLFGRLKHRSFASH